MVSIIINVGFCLCATPSKAIINSPKLSALANALIMSNFRLIVFTGFAGRNMDATMKVQIPIGTLMANNQFHEPIERIAAANDGPDAMDTATTKAFIPIPRPRNLRG